MSEENQNEENNGEEMQEELFPGSERISYE